MLSFEIRGDYTPEEIGHMIIPGRGRTDNGMSITGSGLDRVITAAEFYHEYQWLYRPSQLVIPTGYKSPADLSAYPVTARELGFETLGIPEAVLMARALLRHRVRSNQIKMEVYSIDTVTNLAYARNFIPLKDKRPIGIVSQSAHLERILNHVAPRIIKQPVVGIVVPERDPDNPEKDSLLASLFSKWVVRGLDPETPNLSEITTARAEQGWRIAQGISSVFRKYNYTGQLNSIAA